MTGISETCRSLTTTGLTYARDVIECRDEILMVLVASAASIALAALTQDVFRNPLLTVTVSFICLYTGNKSYDFYQKVYTHNYDISKKSLELQMQKENDLHERNLARISLRLSELEFKLNLPRKRTFELTPHEFDERESAIETSISVFKNGKNIKDAEEGIKENLKSYSDNQKSLDASATPQSPSQSNMLLSPAHSESAHIIALKTERERLKRQKEQLTGASSSPSKEIPNNLVNSVPQPQVVRESQSPA